MAGYGIQRVMPTFKGTNSRPDIVSASSPFPVEVKTYPALDYTTDDITAYIAPPSTVLDGNKTVTTAGTAVQLASPGVSCNYVAITALLANTGLISVGGSTTTPTGTVRGDVLAAGDSTVVLINNTSRVYINSSTPSEGVSFRYG